MNIPPPPPPQLSRLGTALAGRQIQDQTGSLSVQFFRKTGQMANTAVS